MTNEAPLAIRDLQLAFDLSDTAQHVLIRIMEAGEAGRLQPEGCMAPDDVASAIVELENVGLVWRHPGVAQVLIDPKEIVALAAIPWVKQRAAAGWAVEQAAAQMEQKQRQPDEDLDEEGGQE